jgi:P4 family phage/plasmid primase-like protien
MVSRDNPNDPGAVICGRTEQGAVKFIEGSGYLHRLHPSGQSDTVSSVIRDSDKPYILVEGATDVLAAMDVGHVGIGRPSAESGSNLAAALLKGKSVVVLGENDAGAGRRGMDRAFRQLKPRCKELVKCLPPAIYKDLRKWKPTSEEFTAWVKQEGNRFDGETLIYGNFDPVALAEVFINNHGYAKDDKRRLSYHHDDWWVYDAGKYKQLEVKALEAQISKTFHGYEFFDDVAEKTKPLTINNYFKREVLSSLGDLTLSGVSRDVLEPFLLNTGKPFDSSHVVLFKNGILDVLNSKLTPHDNNLFTTATLPYNYDSRTVCPGWITAVYEWLEEDEERITLLQEWFGYNMIASNYLEQLMFIYGVSGSGKSTMLRVLQYLLGDNCMPVNARQLCVDQFGLAPLIGKYAVTVSDDDKLDSRMGKKLLPILKQISGNDAVPIRRMHKLAVSGTLFCKVTYVSNSLPVFLDESQAIFRRYNLLNFGNRTIVQNPDRGLYRKLQGERTGIAAWAVEGLRRLLKNYGNFTLPEASRVKIEEVKIESSPIKHMLSTCLSFDDPRAFTSNTQLRALYMGICDEDQVRYPTSNRSFIRVCKEAMPELEARVYRKCVKTYREWGFIGVGITPEAKQRYLEK